MLAEVQRALKRTSTKSRPLVVDAAAGKSYVGIAAAHLLGRDLDVVAIERNQRRAAQASKAAEKLERSSFVCIEADVADLKAWPDEPDLVVALHACGPAFDTTAASAVAVNAKRMLLVPCCTSDAIVGMAHARVLAERLGLPHHAEVQRRFLQAMIDARRTLTLEAAGYEVEVAAFVPPSVTPHNLVWRARRVHEPVRMHEAAEKLKRLTA